MRTNKPPGLLSPAGLTKLVAHAAMGVAMGLLFALALILIHPSGIVFLMATAQTRTALWQWVLSCCRLPSERH